MLEEVGWQLHGVLICLVVLLHIGGQKLIVALLDPPRLLQTLDLELLLLVQEHALVGLDLQKFGNEVCKTHSIQNRVQIELRVKSLVGILVECCAVNSMLVPGLVLAAAAKESLHQPRREELPVPEAEFVVRPDHFLELALGIFL